MNLCFHIEIRDDAPNEIIVSRDGTIIKRATIVSGYFTLHDQAYQAIGQGLDLINESCGDDGMCYCPAPQEEEREVPSPSEGEDQA